jgi:hypothetical protein
MGWNNHLDDSKPGDLPAEAWGNKFDVDGPFDPDDFWIENADENEQRIAMRECSRHASATRRTTRPTTGEKAANFSFTERCHSSHL